jgi:hypothetical protein
MPRHGWLLSIGLSLIFGASGCLRTADKAVPVAKQPTSRPAEVRTAGTGTTDTYTALPSPRPPMPPPIRESTTHHAAQTAETESSEPESTARVSVPATSTAVRKSEGGPEIDALDFPKIKPSSEHPLVGALQCRLDKRPEEARRLLQSYDPSRQEFLFALLGLLARFADPVPNGSDSPCSGELIDDLKGLLKPLCCRAPLKIEKMCFCQRIKTYGVYEPMLDRPQFRPDDRVQIYVELRNFSSIEHKTPSGETRHVIKLTSSYEIHDESRNVVHADVFLRDRDAADESRTARHDYYENYVFMVPRLKPGFYTLWIQIEDVGTEPSRTARASLDFHVPNTPVQVSQRTN